MRKITKDASNAFMNFEDFNRDNTRVEVIGLQASMYLHDNLIAINNKHEEWITITNAGWQSNVTKERLNGLPGVSLRQCQGQWILNEVPWDGSYIKITLVK